MKVKTSELTGAALDWAVAKADNQLKYITLDHSLTHPLVVSGIQSYGPSFIWSQSGPIIERECIATYNAVGRGWCASMSRWDRPTRSEWSGPTPLVAAMRCFVASKSPLTGVLGPGG